MSARRAKVLYPAVRSREESHGASAMRSERASPTDNMFKMDEELIRDKLLARPSTGAAAMMAQLGQPFATATVTGFPRRFERPLPRVRSSVDVNPAVLAAFVIDVAGSAARDAAEMFEREVRPAPGGVMPHALLAQRRTRTVVPPPAGPASGAPPSLLATINRQRSFIRDASGPEATRRAAEFEQTVRRWDRTEANLHDRARRLYQDARASSGGKEPPKTQREYYEELAVLNRHSVERPKAPYTTPGDVPDAVLATDNVAFEGDGAFFEETAEELLRSVALIRGTPEARLVLARLVPTTRVRTVIELVVSWVKNRIGPCDDAEFTFVDLATDYGCLREKFYRACGLQYTVQEAQNSSRYRPVTFIARAEQDVDELVLVISEEMPERIRAWRRGHGPVRRHRNTGRGRPLRPMARSQRMRDFLRQFHE